MAADLTGIILSVCGKLNVSLRKTNTITIYETGVRAVAENNIEDICSRNINRIKSDMSRRLNRSSLSDLFISFLAKVRFLLFVYVQCKNCVKKLLLGFMSYKF